MIVGLTVEILHLKTVTPVPRAYLHGLGTKEQVFSAPIHRFPRRRRKVAGAYKETGIIASELCNSYCITHFRCLICRRTEQLQTQIERFLRASRASQRKVVEQP